jgi:phosphoadenosine phosphosulfate reductase
MIVEKINLSFKDLAAANSNLRTKSPTEIVAWALNISTNALVTTNFRPYEGAILHACSIVKPDMTVVWCDTGYNTPQTYLCAQKLIKSLNLNIDLFVPQQTAAYRDVVMGIPGPEDEIHALFTQQVKLEPFSRAMKKHQPQIWFTNLRQGQTAHRDGLDILSLTNDGVLKVSPFYYYSDADLDKYMAEFDLANEHKYYDPTKALENRECGLHN